MDAEDEGEDYHIFYLLECNVQHLSCSAYIISYILDSIILLCLLHCSHTCGILKSLKSEASCTCGILKSLKSEASCNDTVEEDPPTTPTTFQNCRASGVTNGGLPSEHMYGRSSSPSSLIIRTCFKHIMNCEKLCDILMVRVLYHNYTCGDPPESWSTWGPIFGQFRIFLECSDGNCHLEHPGDPYIII